MQEILDKLLKALGVTRYIHYNPELRIKVKVGESIYEIENVERNVNEVFIVCHENAIHNILY